MKQFSKKIFLLAIVLAIFSLPITAMGDVVETPQLLTDLITTFTNWGRTIAGALCVLFIILAGINFIWNGGDESKLKTAKNMILYAAVGFAVVVLATAIQGIVASLVGVGGE